MTPNNFSNISVATNLVVGIGIGDLSMTVADDTGYPAAPFQVVIDLGSATNEEAVLVTAKAGTTWTITRAYDGTTVKVHAAGATVVHTALARDFRGLILGTRDMSTAVPSDGDGVVWDDIAQTWGPGTVSGGASGPAGGVLSGTYPNPGFAVDMATQAELDAAIVDLVNTYARLHAANTFTQGVNAFRPGGAAHTMEWQADDSTVLDRIDANGDAFLQRIGVAGGVVYVETGTFAIENEIGLYRYFDNAKPNGKRGIFAGLRAELELDDHAAAETVVGSMSGVFGSVYVYPSSTRLLESLYGLNYVAYNEGSTNSSYLVGAYVSGQAGGSGHVGEVSGLQAYIDNYGSVVQADGAAIRITPSNSSESGFTELYDLKIDGSDPTNCGVYHTIHTGNGLVSFGDDQEFRSTNDGPILIDRNTGNRRRIICMAGALSTEAA